MATPRPYTFYPKEFSELLLRAFETPVPIECASEQAAKRMRGQLYAFRTALSVKNCGADPKLILVAPLLSFTLEGAKLLVHQPNRINTIKKALAHVKSNDSGSAPSIVGSSASPTSNPSDSGTQVGQSNPIPESVRQHNADDA